MARLDAAAVVAVVAAPTLAKAITAKAVVVETVVPVSFFSKSRWASKP